MINGVFEKHNGGLHRILATQFHLHPPFVPIIVTSKPGKKENAEKLRQKNLFFNFKASNEIVTERAIELNNELCYFFYL